MDNNNIDQLLDTNVTVNCVDEDNQETSTNLIVSTLDDENDDDYSEGDLSLREAIALANEQEGTNLISFDDSLSGGTIPLTETQTAKTWNNKPRFANYRFSTN